MAQPQLEPSDLDDQQPAELSLTPVDPEAIDVRKLHNPPPPRFPAPDSEPAPDPVRYSLRELLLVITLTALLLAPIRYIGAAMFAAISGVMAFLILVYISLAKPSRGIVHVAWWVILAIYVVAAVAALVNKDI